MQTRLQGTPCLVAGRAILLVFQNTVLDAPCHAVKEEGCSCHLRSGIVDVAHQAGVPESVLMLTFQQRLAHQDKVLLQLLVGFLLGRQYVHAAHQGGIDPPVATTPVAVLAVLLLIGRHIVLVAPPETFLHVEATASAGVACPVVATHGIVQVFLVFRDGIHLHIDRHRHLDGINPCPVVDAVGAYLIVQVLTGKLQRSITCQLVQFDIRLSATLVVSIRSLHATTGHPLVMVCPSLGIVEIAFVGVDAIESHQSFVIDGTGPQVAFTHPLDKSRNGGVTVLGHKVVVGFLCCLQHLLLSGDSQGHAECENCKNCFLHSCFFVFDLFCLPS